MKPNLKLALTMSLLWLIAAMVGLVYVVKRSYLVW